MPSPISVSDPILATVAVTDGVTPAFLGDVVGLINRSPNLLTEINRLDATALPGGTAEIEIQSGQQNGGNTFYHSPVIDIAALLNYDDGQVTYAGGSLVAGQTETLTSAGAFVGILAHEIGHWGDASLGPIYTSGGLDAYTLEQSVATEFASEGKAAYSQYTAMTQIQASEAGRPVPSDMANGNVLFDMSSNPARDTVVLQTEQSLARGPSPYAASVSYLGSQFWDVPVDGGTYLTTMWDGYGASGASNDLGIDGTRITGYQVSANAAGTLQGCTIQTGTAAGASWTYRMSFASVGTQQAVVTDDATGVLIATIGTVVTPVTGAVRLSIAADGFAFTVIDAAVAAVQGHGDSLTLGIGDSLFLSGDGHSVTGAAGNTINLSASSSAVIAAGGEVVNLNGDAAAVTAAAGSTIHLSAARDSVTASGSSVIMGPASSGQLVGSDDTIAVSAGDRLCLAGNANSVIGSHAGLLLSGTQAVSVTGDSDTLSGGAAADLQVALSGTGSMLSLTTGSATVMGGAATTVFGGASDVDYGGDGGIVVMGSGAATVAGAVSGVHQTVFGGGSGLLYQGAAEYADVIGGAGSCTIHAGSGGGWYGGGSDGGNLLDATGGGTVLDAGGNGDTLVGASGGGTWLIAAAGNETLFGGNQSGESDVFFGSGSDLLVAGKGGSVIGTGTGAATVYGGGGKDQVWGGSGGADLFVAGNGGQIEIHGFRTGTDHLATGAQAVSGAAQLAGGTLFTLSSGSTILLAGVEAPSAPAFA